MIRTLPAVQKALVLRRFCSAYSKNRTKDRAAKNEQKARTQAGSGQSQSRQLPAVHFCQCSRLALIPFQSNKRRGFRFRAIPSTFQISSQPTPAHTTPARAEAFRPAASRPQNRPTFPANITTNTTKNAQKRAT